MPCRQSTRNDAIKPPSRLLLRCRARAIGTAVVLAHVGLGVKPEPKFLKSGDVAKLGIDGRGEQTQKVVKFKM